MANRKRHHEGHKTERMGWLRAAVLGANDGIVSTASLVLGVAAAHSARGGILLAGGAGLVAGAMSMAAGEYVSVHSQADIEAAELEREREELAQDPEGELRVVTGIYERRGLDHALAKEVAKQLTARDATGAHARDELGLTTASAARPLQAALASAASFTVGAALPLVVTALVPLTLVLPLVAAASLVFLAVLGAVSARTGGAPVLKATARVTFWGALAMGATAGLGALAGTAV